MCTNLAGVRSFFLWFSHHFALAKLATSSNKRVNVGLEGAFLLIPRFPPPLKMLGTI